MKQPNVIMWKKVHIMLGDDWGQSNVLSYWTSPVISGFPSQRASNAEIWEFISFQPDHAVQQICYWWFETLQHWCDVLVFHAACDITVRFLVKFDNWQVAQQQHIPIFGYLALCLLITKVYWFISYLGIKSWDLHVCDRASTITHVDRVKKSNPWYNEIWLWLNVTIWSSQACLSVIFIHFVIISKYLGKKLHLFTLFFNHPSLLQLIFGRL